MPVDRPWLVAPSSLSVVDCPPVFMEEMHGASILGSRAVHNSQPGAAEENDDASGFCNDLPLGAPLVADLTSRSSSRTSHQVQY